MVVRSSRKEISQENETIRIVFSKEKYAELPTIRKSDFEFIVLSKKEVFLAGWSWW